MAVIDFALKYVAEGFPVIPLCHPDFNGACGCGRNHIDRAIGKVPLTEHGLKDATMTQQGVREYWTKYPRANIGIVIPPGFFVLDVDVGHGGFDSLSKLQYDLDMELPATWLITTGSGGAHYWYKTDKPIRNTARLAGYEGLDIRGLGGYVVAPPSIHRSGMPYEVSPVWDGAIVQTPDKLIELCLKPMVTALPTLAGVVVYQEGQRNATLASQAGAMRRRGLSEQAILAALQVANREQCNPPLSEREVDTIAKSIGRYEPITTPNVDGKPRFRGGL